MAESIQRPQKEQPRKPWEQQHGERTKWYRGFEIYRDMGPSRVLAKVAQPLAKSERMVRFLSQKYGWVRRCEAWDYHLNKEILRRLQQESTRMAERHVNLATNLLGLVAGKIRQMYGPDGQLLENIPVSQIAKLFEIGTKVERLSRGEPTERYEEKKVERDFSQVPTDKLEAFEKAYTGLLESAPEEGA